LNFSLQCGYYSARSLASAEYWIHFMALFSGVHAFGVAMKTFVT